MPHSVIIFRAIAVACRMSLLTPLFMSPVNISSAMRPPNVILMNAVHHLRE